MSRRLLLAAAALTLVASGWSALPTLAGTVPDMTITPAEGPPGTVITVAGVGCDDEGGSTLVEISLYDTEDDRAAEATAEPDVDGEWSTTVTVPADTTLYGEWRVAALCMAERTLGVESASVSQVPLVELFEYADEPFLVLEPAQPPAPEVPASPPAAAPVAAEAPFTG